MKKVLVLLGHPNSESLSGHFADVYAKAAAAAGHEVRRVNIGDLSFDPILHKGYREIQQLEPDLLALKEDIQWCEHLVLVYPIWWLSMPALLKGLIDRLWLPGFAFRYHKSKSGKRQLGWDQLLKGRTSRLIVLIQTSPLLEYLAFGDFTNEMAHGILGFAGIKAKVTKVGHSETLTPEALARWEGKIESLAVKPV